MAFVEEADVETLAFDWGRLWWLSEKRVTGARRFSVGVVDVGPGQGHGRHNHPGCEEIIYVLAGRGKFMVEVDGQPVEREIGPGALNYIAPSAFHSSLNTGSGPLRSVVVYCPAGPEDVLRRDKNVKILPPKR